MAMRTRLAAASLAAAMAAASLAGCTDDPEAESSEDLPAEETFGTKPDVPSMLPGEREDPPSGLQAVDLVVGQGQQVEPGTVVTVHYAAARWRDGVELDSTWDLDEPYVFEVGAGRVIEGWEIGVGGSDSIEPMRVGGRRMLTIPAEQAYGERGAGDDVGPGEALVFVLDLLDVEQPAG